MRNRLGRGVVAAITICAAITLSTGSVAFAASGSISGSAYQDMDRDGFRDAGEQPFSGHQIYLFNAAGSYVAGVTTNSDGQFVFTGLADGSFTVEYAAPSWWNIRESWVPTTTGSIKPRMVVGIIGGASEVANFGWRPIVRSTDLAAPIARYVGSNGLQVAAYNDAVDPHELFDALMRGWVGEEASTVVVRFAYSGSSTTSTSSMLSGGQYSNYHATSYVTFLSWLDGGDITLSHEYGHAWTLYYATIVQQDMTLASYIEARGLTGDSRLGSTYAWSARELIAEDYRQLFGSPTARVAPQTNRDLAAAADVPGLRDFFQTTFVTAPAPPPATTPPPAPAIQITGLQVSPTQIKRTGTISFSLNVPGNATVQVLDKSGVVVRTLLSAAAEPSGSTSVVWDRTGNDGRRVRTGSYTVKVTASDANGNTAAATASCSVA